MEEEEREVGRGKWAAERIELGDVVCARIVMQAVLQSVRLEFTP